MQAVIVTLLLFVVKTLSRLFFTHRIEWVGDDVDDRWRDIRIICVLNHTSLYEPLLLGFAPWSLIWSVARHGVMPVAEKTMRRPIGLFFRFLVAHVIVVSRQRDHTWSQVLDQVDAQSVTVILPEGRMKRRNGLDSTGKPLTVRGGIADILLALDHGRALIVYSRGLHHIQAPGELLPRPFKPIDAKMEIVDIQNYRAKLGGGDDVEAFRSRVIADLTRRRDEHCPSGSTGPGEDADASAQPIAVD